LLLYWTTIRQNSLSQMTCWHRQYLVYDWNCLKTTRKYLSS